MLRRIKSIWLFITLRTICPICGGSGVRVSECDARYGGDFADTCDSCNGTGAQIKYGVRSFLNRVK